MVNEEAKAIKQANGKRKKQRRQRKKQVTERQLKYESLYKSKYIRKTDGKINNFNINITE